MLFSGVLNYTGKTVTNHYGGTPRLADSRNFSAKEKASNFDNF